MSGPEDLLGNGKLTVASRLSSVFNGGASIVGGGFLIWFGLQVLDRLEKLETLMQDGRIEMAAAKERGHALRAADVQFREQMNDHEKRLVHLERAR